MLLVDIVFFTLDSRASVECECVCERFEHFRCFAESSPKYNDNIACDAASAMHI